MKNISFQDNNLEEFTINGDSSRIIRFDPTDIGILERLGTFKEQLDIKMRELEATTNSMVIHEGMTEEESEQIFDRAAALIRDVNAFIRQQTNYIFDGDVADAAFGNQSPLSTVKGVPLVYRFFDAVTPVIEKALAKEHKASQERISKYTKRYHK